MKNFLGIIDGHKTQITALLTLLTGFAVTHGWIAKDYADLTLSVIGILLSASIAHHEVKKAGE